MTSKKKGGPKSVPRPQPKAEPVPATDMLQAPAKNARRRRQLIFAALGVLVLVAALCVGPMLGCGGPPDVLPPAKSSAGVQQDSAALFENAVANLQRLPDYGPQEMLEKIREQLNDWAAQDKSSPSLELDPLFATLPSELQQAVMEERRKQVKYNMLDGLFLQEAIWLRDAAALAVRSGRQAALPRYYDEDDDRQKAAALFDWTVRNIQLDAEPDDPRQRVPLRPWEVLLLGRGTAIERSWLFLLLARQQHLDVALVATADTKSAHRFRAPALVHNGQLYLFDMKLGLPIPGPKGKGIATLKEAAEDATVLAQLDVEGAPYPIRAADLSEVVVLVEADLPYLSRRMKQIETKLTHQRKMVLSTVPSRTAEALAGSPHAGNVRLWLWPYQCLQLRAEAAPEAKSELGGQLNVAYTKWFKHKSRIVQEERDLNQPGAKGPGGADQPQPAPGAEGQPQVVLSEKILFPYWSARQRHFQGQFQQPADATPTDRSDDAAAESAKTLYLDARYAVENLREVPPDQMTPEVRAQLERLEQMRRWATYQLGLVHFEAGDYPEAMKYFEEVKKDGPTGPFYPGSIYNLARACQATGQNEQALKGYEDPAVSMPIGCKLRAKWLRQTMSPAK